MNNVSPVILDFPAAVFPVSDASPVILGIPVAEFPVNIVSPGILDFPATNFPVNIVSPGIPDFPVADFPVNVLMDYPVSEGVTFFAVISPKMMAKEKCWGIKKLSTPQGVLTPVNLRAIFIFIKLSYKRGRTNG